MKGERAVVGTHRGARQLQICGNRNRQTRLKVCGGDITIWFELVLQGSSSTSLARRARKSSS